jgi:hypothetical protein
MFDHAGMAPMLNGNRADLVEFKKTIDPALCDTPNGEDRRGGCRRG